MVTHQSVEGGALFIAWRCTWLVLVDALGFVLIDAQGVVLVDMLIVRNPSCTKFKNYSNIKLWIAV